MPRFLPKLVQRIRASKNENIPKTFRTVTSRSRSARRITPKALSPPSFSPHGRKRSILLDDTNPIIHRDAYIQHKHDGPIIPSSSGRGTHTNSSRQVQEMTDHECKWWSDPYLRMLASPLRQCLVTQKQLPAEFMIRLAVLRVAGPRLSQPLVALLPDGVEHPRFRRRNSGRGYYLTCHKIFVDEMSSRSSHKRIPWSNIRLHDLLADQIGYQLRLRVLQELELLAESLRCTPQGSLENIILRRLTRAEWAEVKASDRISWPGAVALLVVPPLNKPKPSNDKDDYRDGGPSRKARLLPPLSVLHETQETDYDERFSRQELDSLFPSPRVPLYNGLTLFPSRPMRLRFYRALQNALMVERRARWRQGASSPRAGRTPGCFDNKPTRDKADQKASHAYLLCSDEKTVRRADSVPLATALWRIRMWEGQG